MLNAIKTAFGILFFGFILPFKIWKLSMIRLIDKNNGSFDDLLDNQYVATSWLDWVVDSIIFLMYPFGLILIILAIILIQEFFIIFLIIPLYFSTLLISFARELGGSFMLLHINIKDIKKNLNKDSND